MALFNLFGRPGRPTVRRRTVLSVLSLDDRALPSAVTPTAPSLIGSAATTSGTLAGTQANAATFQISEFNALEVALGWYRFYGRVTGTNVGGLTISLGGGPESVQGITTTTEADGTFSVLVRVKTDGSDTGTVTATASDGLGNTSNVAQVFIQPTMSQTQPPVGGGA